MNIIKQYAIGYDLPLQDVEAVAQYIDPIVNPELFAQEVKNISSEYNDWADMQYVNNMDIYMENMVD